MDPHSLNESFQLAFTGNIYEPLIGRGKKLEVVPLLATDWKQTAPTVWRFNLRKGVLFHDGTPFTADDVIFSYNRGKGEGSDVKTYVGQIKEIRKLDDHTIDIITTEPFPDSAGRDHQLVHHVARAGARRTRQRSRSTSARVPRTPHRSRPTAPARTACARATPMYARRCNAMRATGARSKATCRKSIFTPIGNSSTRVAALLSGEVDMMEPVPVQDIARISADPNLKVMQAPELRTIFLGMDQSRNELLQSNIKGQESVQGQARSAGVLSGDRRQRDSEGRDARCVGADRADDRAGYQRVCA